MVEETEQKVMRKIEEEKITPLPRSYFVAKNYFFWAIFFVSLVLGSFSFGIAAFILFKQDWYLYQYLSMGMFYYIMVSLPYFWILALVIFLFFSYYYFRNTKKGYKYGYYAIFGSLAFAIFFMGLFFLATGFCEQAHYSFAKGNSFYDRFVFDKEDAWANPEKGLLAGRVVSVENNLKFTILDKNGKTWNIVIDSQKLPGGATVKTGQTVRLVGKSKDGGIFLADMSRP